MAELPRLTIDDITEDAANAPLELNDPDNGLHLTEIAFPTPERDIVWVSSADTEGEGVGNTRYRNREIPIGLALHEPDDAAATNLHKNPSAEVNVTDGGITTSNVTVVRTTGQAWAGNASFEVTSVAAGNGSLRHFTDRSAVTAGTTYTAAAYFRPGPTLRSVRVYIDYYDSTNTRIEAVAGTAVSEVAGGWVRATQTRVAPSGAVTAQIICEVANMAAGELHYIDAQMLVAATAPSAYFDGDSPGCRWTSTRHASTSTRPAPNGPRRDAIVAHLQQKLAKINREGGTLRAQLPGGEQFTFDLLDAGADQTVDIRLVTANYSDLSLKLTAKPFWRGAVQTFSAATETTLPVLIFTVSGVKGDVPALGRLVIDELQGADQWWVAWGLQSRWYDPAASAALFFEAESRTPLGGATAVAGPSGASGSGSNVVRQGTLTPSWQAMLSTQASGGGAHLSHVGSFRVFARVQTPITNTGAVSLALEWAEGDFRRRTVNAQLDFAANHSREGQWVLVDLGLVHLTKVVQGTQRWEGRILAKSTVLGNDLDVDYLLLCPVDEGYGEVSAALQFENPTSFSARDEFDQAAGALAGKTAPVGGIWAGAGDADDFTINTTDDTAQRTATGDAGSTGRYATLDLNLAATVVQVELKTSAIITSGQVPKVGVLARFADVNNWVAARVIFGGFGVGSATSRLELLKRTAGFVDAIVPAFDLPGVQANTWYTLRLVLDTQGRTWAWWFTPGSTAGKPILAAYDSALATGGALAAGDVGIVDEYENTTAVTRTYDNFRAFVPTADAAVFANQSLEIRSDRAIREDSSGAFWNPVSDPQGDYLRTLPAGREGRTSRLIVKASRNDPTTSSDPNIDDIRATLSVTPRGLVVPGP